MGPAPGSLARSSPGYLPGYLYVCKRTLRAKIFIVDFPDSSRIQSEGVIKFYISLSRLKNASNFLAVNPSKAVQDIRTELAQLIKELQVSDDIKTLAKLKVELGRIQRLGGFEAIVPSEGIVFVYRGQTYKLTGAFAPVNQILGVLKYSR